MNLFLFLHRRSIANKVINAVTVENNDITAIEYQTYSDNKLETHRDKIRKAFRSDKAIL